MVHALHTVVKDDKLFFAPITNPKRILDIGTGTGLWAVQVGDEHPDAQVLGNDLSPIQPRWVPPNVIFEVDDVEAEWPDGRAPFDLVHARYMAGSIKDWPGLLRNCYDSLKPGGWVECSDWDLLPYATDGSVPEDDAVLRLHQLLVEATDKLGRTVRPGPRLEGGSRMPGSSTSSTSGASFRSGCGRRMRNMWADTLPFFLILSEEY